MAERSINKVILIGRIGADAESRVTQNGTPVSRLSLAHESAVDRFEPAGARRDRLDFRRDMEQGEAVRVSEPRGSQRGALLGLPRVNGEEMSDCSVGIVWRLAGFLPEIFGPLTSAFPVDNAADEPECLGNVIAVE
jgi:Single-strand binding protein family